MLKVNQTEINLGDLKYGQTHKFSYKIKNTSDKVIIINRLYAGCSSCTKASMAKGSMEPGEESEVHIEFTPGSTGPQNKSVSIAYSSIDDRVRAYPDMLLKFKATVNK